MDGPPTLPATLLTFLLSPVANALQRWGFGRAASVLVVVALAFSLIAGAGWALTQQVSTLGDQVPTYTATIKEKLAHWRRRSRGRDRESGGGARQADARRHQGAQRGLLAQVTAVTEPLATAGLVALLVAIAVWTGLWGPPGLLLATPLTVCLVVLSKYIPEMSFVTILAPRIRTRRPRSSSSSVGPSRPSSSTTD